MSQLYKNYLKLLERWPLEPTKKGRDLAEYLRAEVKEGFRNGQAIGDVKACEKNYESLKRLADDHYKNQYPRSAQFSSSSLSADSCKILLANENLSPVPGTWIKNLWKDFRGWQKSK